MNSLIKTFLRGLTVAVLILVAVVGIVMRSRAVPQWEIDAAAARAQGMAAYQSQPAEQWKPSRTHDEFIKMIQDVYDVDVAKFVRHDYLQVVFSSRFDEEPQGTCQAIANLWYNETRQPSVAVDSWKGETRTAHATVINGHMITPPPPAGRRAHQP